MKVNIWAVLVNLRCVIELNYVRASGYSKLMEVLATQENIRNVKDAWGLVKETLSNLVTATDRLVGRTEMLNQAL